MDVEKRS